jgi:hypothetical protein
VYRHPKMPMGRGCSLLRRTVNGGKSPRTRIWRSQTRISELFLFSPCTAASIQQKPRLFRREITKLVPAPATTLSRRPRRIAGAFFLRCGRSESACTNCHLSAYVGSLPHGCKPHFKDARPVLRSRTEFVLRPWLFAAKAFIGSPVGPVIRIAAHDLAATRVRNRMAGPSHGLGKFLGGLRGCSGATAADSGGKNKYGKREQISHANPYGCAAITFAARRRRATINAVTRVDGLTKDMPMRFTLASQAAC